jgi:pheromone shutdown protein TraB
MPRLVEPLLHERDLWLTYSLRHCPGNRVVGVVGAGHVPGIVAAWARPDQELDPRALAALPPPSRHSRRLLFASLAAVIALAAFWLAS